MSSYGGNCCPTDGACEAILRGIDRVNGQNNTTFNSTPVGALQAISSDINRQDANFDEINDRSGAVRKVRVKRIPRGTAADVSSTIGCDVTTTSTYVEECISINNEAYVALDVTKTELQSYCNDLLLVESGGSPSGVFRVFLEKLYGKMEAMRKFLNDDVITLLEANGGVNASTGLTTPTSINVKYCAGGGKVEEGISTIITDYYTSNELKGIPFVIGAGNFDSFNTSMAFGCCNQYGLDFGTMAASQPYYYLRDRAVGTITGDKDRIFVLAPGAVQFISYNDWVIDSYLQGGRPTSSLSMNKFADYRKGVIPDNIVPNLMYDLRISELGCTSGFTEETFRLALYLRYDLVFIPDTAYAASDPLYQTNGVLKYKATCL